MSCVKLSERCQTVKKMSNCQKNVKMMSGCQKGVIVKKISNVKKSNTWTMEEVDKKTN